MLSLHPLLDFSRCHCVSICAALVPINILATALTVYKTSRNHSTGAIKVSIGIASLAAGLLALHDLSWLIIGVIMAPTYILFTIAMVCLSFNIWAGCYPDHMRRTVLKIIRICQRGMALLWPHPFATDSLLELDAIPLDRTVDIRRHQSQPRIRIRR